MLTGAAQHTIHLQNKRIFLSVSDIMLLEGYRDRNAAAKYYRTLLILVGKVPERRDDSKPDQKILLTVKDYADYNKISEEYVYEHIPDIPFSYKEIKK